MEGDESDANALVGRRSIRFGAAPADSAVTSREFPGRRFEMKSSLIAILGAAALLAGCTQTAGAPVSLAHLARSLGRIMLCSSARAERTRRWMKRGCVAVMNRQKPVPNEPS